MNQFSLLGVTKYNTLVRKRTKKSFNKNKFLESTCLLMTPGKKNPYFHWGDLEHNSDAMHSWAPHEFEKGFVGILPLR